MGHFCFSEYHFLTKFSVHGSMEAEKRPRASTQISGLRVHPALRSVSAGPIYVGMEKWTELVGDGVAGIENEGTRITLLAYESNKETTSCEISTSLRSGRALSFVDRQTPSALCDLALP